MIAPLQPPSSSALDEANAAALLVGTAIGGGFLALPYSTAPAGCVPSSTALAACWLLLLMESMLISDLIIDRSALSPQGSPTPSFASLSLEAFGGIGGIAVSAVFVVLMITTLTSQLAKAGALLAPAFPTLPAVARCILLASALGAFGRCAPAPLLGQVNGLLAFAFVVSTAFLFAQAAPHAVWQRLARSDWTAAAGALPTLLQLV